jgi:hypothetical protein
MRKQKPQQVGHQPSLDGNILDIKGKKNNLKAATKLVQPESKQFFSEFVPDIDNFEGVKEIKNYCIASLIDNGYGTGDLSVGVVQLYNKLDGNPIDKEDVARV